jgi:hypothetical protein
MCKTNERLRLEDCSDCYENTVVVEEDYKGSAYCSDCMTLNRLKETQPKIYRQALKEINQ